MESRDSNSSELPKSQNGEKPTVTTESSQPIESEQDSQNTYCEVRSPGTQAAKDSQDLKDTDSIFSQETEYIPSGQIQALTPEKEICSNEVEIIKESVPMVVLESGTESMSDKIEITTSSNSSNGNRDADSPNSKKRFKLNEADSYSENMDFETTQSLNLDSITDMDQNIIFETSNNTISKIKDIASRPITPTEIKKCSSPSVRVMRSSPRLVAKRSNSCTPLGDDKIIKAGKRLKRCLSADIEIERKNLQTSGTISPHEFYRTATLILKDSLPPLIESLSLDTLKAPNETKSIQINSTIYEDVSSDASKAVLLSSSSDSQNFISDSQNVHLHFSPTPSENSEIVSDEALKTVVVHENTSKLIENKPHPEISERHAGLLDEPFSHSNDVGNSHSLSDSYGLLKRVSSGGIVTDHDSTVSPLETGKPALLTKKNEPYLSNGHGHTSSTPEPFTQSMLFKTMKRHSIHVSDSESDSTPTFDYSKPPFSRSKRSLTPKSDSSLHRADSSVSPLRNGHSNVSYFANTSSTVPSFDVQIYCDENNEFLSLFVVKTDTDLGGDVCKEYQRLSKRLAVDPYLADGSKVTSPSSVTSGGLLHLPAQPRSSFMSVTSSTSSSSRTSDGAFAIPQRPRKIFSGTRPVPVKGWQALRRRVDEILSGLTDAYAGDDSAHSQIIDESLDIQKKMNDLDNGAVNEAEEGHRNTPKSSKKKTQTRGKRPPPGKTKKTVLPITDEEHDLQEAIHSPEMIPTDPERCRLAKREMEEEATFATVTSPACTLKIKDRKIIPVSPAVLSTPVPPLDAIVKPEFGTHPEGTLVFARWVDKKYYSGKVKRSLDLNKYLIEFDDGHSKPLLDDFIIFGDARELPVTGQSVYAAVDDDHNYEPSLVLSVEVDEVGGVRYKCTTDRHSTVSVTASDICLTEDQARIIKESVAPKSPHSTPTTPRRRGNRELDLENIIQGPRSARTRDKVNTPSRRGLNSSPSSPKASTSGTRGRSNRKENPVMQRKRRQESESSEGGDVASRASSTALEEVGGVQPEVQKTPRKIEGVKAIPLQIKGMSKQNIGKKSSKVMKFENDNDTVSRLGPIPDSGTLIFSGLHFLLTCTDVPKLRSKSTCEKRKSPLWSDNDSQCNSSSPNTEKEDNPFTTIPFHKERLKEQLEMGGGTVYSHFEDVPKNKYSVCKLIAPRPCLTAKYIQCLSADIKSLSHHWVVRSCLDNQAVNMNEDALPAGWSIERSRFINWRTCSYERISATPFRDKLILLCSDNDNFTKFWDRVCTLAGANTRIINEDSLELDGGLVVVTESDCSHEVQNKAILDNIPLVSTIWVVQCLIEGKICKHSASLKYYFTFDDD